ncbi:putative Domain often clustered or fused with uracil-DNA glycosylase / Uracil-DNA glycosylase, family 6 [Novosphingobium sp. 9U]|nr:putative Domain often clustered or fused with uracil-DNA glycosylase / Uracil-DNA glycosylase, family 6 [Novosphingobium sp. 9U]
MTIATDPLPQDMMRAPPARVVRLAGEDDWEGWRDAARRFLAARVEPERIVWHAGESADDLFADGNDTLPPEPQLELRVPRQFPQMAQSALLHSDPERFALLYRLLWQITEHPGLLSDQADPLVRRVELMAKAVRRDIHKMHAFVRFREVETPAAAGEAPTTRFVAWFEPEHHIVRATAGFFVRRFAQMAWSILTPELCIHWDGQVLTESPGADRSQAPREDALEDMWKAYYASTFNPARLKIGAMTREMPRKYWKNLPEAQLIAPLIAGAQAREAHMVAQQVAPTERAGTLQALAEEAQGCRRCPLWKGTNGCVFGEGPGDARLMIVGEQPGDEEDKSHRPFVGPAGGVLDRALNEAGIDRGEVYLTNAVKHFKYVMRGKRRLHQKPDAPEIDACRWWLDQEIGLVRPRATIMLGATAVRGVTGKTAAIGKARGTPMALAQGTGVVTWHPSYILRLPERDAADRAYAGLVEDLRLAAEQASVT